MYTRKVLFVSKLSLGLVLLLVIVKTAMLPWHLGRIFLPTSASGNEDISARLLGVEAGHTGTTTEDYSAIVRRNIFGDANSSPTANKSLPGDPAAQDGLQPAEEELGLALVGTVSGSPAVSRAIIKDIQTNMLNLYKTGQTVAGACVESIEKNAVILLHNGQRKTLTLKTTVKSADGAGGNHTRTPSSQQTVSRTTTVAKPNLPLNEAPAQVPAKIEQVESILGQAVVEPYVVKGQVEGLKVTGLEGIGAAKDLGLKNGDIIRVVNGQQVTSKQKAYQIFKKARTQAIIDIELLRSNEPQKLSFPLR